MGIDLPDSTANTLRFNSMNEQSVDNVAPAAFNPLPAESRRMFREFFCAAVIITLGFATLDSSNGVIACLD